MVVTTRAGETPGIWRREVRDARCPAAHRTAARHTVILLVGLVCAVGGAGLCPFAPASSQENLSECDRWKDESASIRR